MEKFADLFESKIEIKESKDDQVLNTIIFPWAKADSENLNKRTYPFEVLQNATTKLSEKIKVGFIPGQTDHPLMGGGTRLGDVSHILKAVWMKDKVAYAEADILKTTKGSDVLKVIKSGVAMGASLRGFGEIDSGGKVKKGLEVASVDLVANPSFGADAKVGVDNIVIESTILDEAFFSLRDSLATAIKKEFGKEHWLVDFSNNVAVFKKDGDTAEEQYNKISYKIKGQEVELTGEAEKVKRQIQYEGSGELSQDELRQSGVHSGQSMLKEQKQIGRSLEEGQFFTEYIMSGGKLNFQDWKKAREE